MTKSPCKLGCQCGLHNSRSIPDTVKNEAIRLRASGLSLNKIAEKLNVSSSAVWQWCNRERVLENRERNREHAWELERKRRERNREHHLAKRRAWRSIPENSERERERARDWTRRNREKIKDYKRNYEDKHPEDTMLMLARRRARKEGIKFDLKREDINIPERCPYLDIPLFRGRGRQTVNSPTLDRIDPIIGYVPGNVIVVSYRANTMKYDCDLQTLIEFGQRIDFLVKNNPKFKAAAELQAQRRAGFPDE